jgi:hypothetical protein
LKNFFKLRSHRKQEICQPGVYGKTTVESRFARKNNLLLLSQRTPVNENWTVLYVRMKRHAHSFNIPDYTAVSPLKRPVWYNFLIVKNSFGHNQQIDVN